MTRKKRYNPTEAELEILKILWQFGPPSVRSVNDRLNETKRVGYTTTLKFMQIMVEKGVLKRNENQRSHIYRPIIKEKETIGHLMDRFLNNVFEGSSVKFVMQALGNRRASKEEIAQIKQYLADLEGGEK